MDVLIYGAGQNCKSLIEAAKLSADIRVKGIFDTYIKGERFGFEILDICKFKDYGLPNDLPVIISLGALKDAVGIARKIQRNGFINVYWYLNKTKIFSDNFLEANCIKLPNLSKDAFLPSLEVHVADFCNLNCAGCVHFSPLFEKIFPDKDKRLDDLNIISSLVDHVGVLSLLGGEPLLNPDCIHYVNEARKCFPKSEIQLVTNGLLLLKVKEDLFHALHENNITLIISEYEPTHKLINAIIKKLDEWSIDYTIRAYEKKQKFNRPLSIRKGSQHELYCICDGCVGVCDGKVARCPVVLYIRKFNERFKQNLPEYGVWQLSDFRNGDELLRRMEEKIPLCDYCIRNEMDWHMCTREASITDFAVLD